MFIRLVTASISRAWRKKMLVVLSAALGATVAAAMLTVSLDIRDKMGCELKSYGANLVLTSAVDPLSEETLAGEDLLAEEDIPLVKTIFWRNNILDFAPLLQGRAGVKAGGGQGAGRGKTARGAVAEAEVVGTWFDRELVIPTGETVRPGLRGLRSWWKMEGRWPSGGENAAVAGADIAERLGLEPGSTVTVDLPEAEPVHLTVAGVADTEGEDSSRIYVPPGVVQKGLGLQGRVERVELSALTTPENDLARKAEADPDSLTPREFELWYCTAYVGSIAYQLEETLPGTMARPVRSVSEAEGGVLRKIERLMWLLTAVALAGAGLSISSLMSTSILERRAEIGLAKAIGAHSATIVRTFLVEAGILAVAGGVVGFGAGTLPAQAIGFRAFGTVISWEPVVLPLTLVLSVGVVWVSSISAISTIVRLNPKEAIFGR